MALTHVLEFDAPLTSSDIDGPSRREPIEKELLAESQALVRKPGNPIHMAIGTQIQPPNSLQLTLEWDDTHDQNTTTHTASPFLSLLHSTFGLPSKSYHIPLSNSPFSPNPPRGAATAPVTEYVLSYHPSLLVTPSYKAKIESDFAKFYSTFKQEARGDSGLITGWVTEELEHEDLGVGEKASCFFVMNGWESMGHFEKSTSTESFKKALPILMGWGVPFRLWHVESTT